MTDQDRVLRTLAEYLAPALRYPLGDITREKGRLLGVLGVEAGAGAARVEAALREALGAPVPGPDELAAAIRDTPVLVENYGYDDSVGAFTATAMLPDELAAVLLDKAWDEARP
jgi:hypothetical protein